MLNTPRCNEGYVIAPRPPGLVRGAGRGAGRLGQEELTGVRDFETINHALFLRSSLVGGPGSTHLSVFDSALRALCSTQRGLLVHVGRPHERGALRGERAVDRLDERAVEPGASDAAASDISSPLSLLSSDEMLDR